jgi:hypothetical protein
LNIDKQKKENLGKAVTEQKPIGSYEATSLDEVSLP